MRRRLAASRARSGFTLMEVMLASALMAVVTVKVHGVMTTANCANTEATRRIVLEDKARRVLQQIAVAIMGANRETLIPEIASPASMSDVRYQVNLGVENGEVIWGDPERIALDEPNGAVFWSDNVGTATERRVTWTRIATPFLEGELPNGMDDNGNGLIDEKGLCFEVDRNAVRIRLTLENVADDGQVLTETVETTVTCRNLTTVAE
ncbi:MAG: prepilin-type N-terminal cleavage/methylation domain-containing protein [Planctomycetota bacterium]